MQAPTPRFFGMPYDIRRPTWDRVVMRHWQPGGPLFPPKTFGIGWGLNFAHPGAKFVVAGIALAMIYG